MNRISEQIFESIKRFFFGRRTRTLSAAWRVEIAQDLKAIHGIDVEKEIADILKHEIDQEILKSIHNQKH